MFEGLLAKLALGWAWGKAKAVTGWQSLSPKAKRIILGIVLALILAFVHQLYAHRQAAKQWNAGYQQAMKDVQTRALKNKAKVDTKTSAITSDERKKNDAENNRISRAADALSVRGPGKASCAVRSELPSGSGGHGKAAAVGNAAGPQLPDADRAGVPWPWLVQRAKEHDALLAEVKSWHAWHNRVLEVWPKETPK